MLLRAVHEDGEHIELFSSLVHDASFVPRLAHVLVCIREWKSIGQVLLGLNGAFLTPFLALAPGVHIRTYIFAELMGDLSCDGFGIDCVEIWVVLMAPVAVFLCLLDILVDVARIP